MKKTKKKTSRVKIGRYPFIIHADPLKERTAYPTHTHGLYDIGMPEFVMDPVAFGGKGNGGRINCSYDYFKKPKNKAKLKSILNGKTLKLPGKQLCQKHLRNDPYTYCFREVSPEFEAVKLAYPGDIAAECPGIRLIQIYVEGDDYVLLDDYYRGGVRW
jgi:hypothetical protein